MMAGDELENKKAPVGGAQNTNFIYKPGQL